MQKPFIISALGLLFLFGTMSVQAQQIKVMQYNIEGHLGNLASNNTASAKALARIINFHRPDVVTFCEVQDQGSPAATAVGMIDWVTNNLTYFGNKTGVTFWVDIAASPGDPVSCVGSISRYPITISTNYSDAENLGGTNYPNLRQMEAFTLQLSGTNTLEVFHVHLKCCTDCGGGTCGCPQRQSEAEKDATNITNWASTHTFPYIFTGDCNEDEDGQHDSIECPTNSTYHPITTLKQGGGLAEYRPKDLDGSWLTWSSSSPSIRFDYVLPAAGRISLTPSDTTACIVTGFVFNSSVWAAVYTNAAPTNSPSDSVTAADHDCVVVTYSFPATGTNFVVTPTGTFTSSGVFGGPFSPASQTYALTNTDVAPLFWAVTNGTSWLSISATNGTLPVGWGTNITAFITNAVATTLADGTYTDTIGFSNTATGVSVARPVTLTISSVPPSASFTGSPTNGTEPLVVTFSDTSTGTVITNRFWDFGDATTTNTTTNTMVHTYTAGTYPVTLIVNAYAGVSTNTKPNYISVLPAPSTLTVDAGYLYDRFGTDVTNLVSADSVAVLVVDTGTNGFVDPQPDFPLSLGATWGTDDRIVGLWNPGECNNGDGTLFCDTVVTYTNGIAPGQKLQLYWFPSLTLASNTVGATYFGKYSDTNSPTLDGSDAWQIPASDSGAYLIFWTVSYNGSNPEPAGQATLLAKVPLLALFTGAPTSGLEPLAVTFSDTSTGSISNRFWDFGDGGTTNTTTNSMAHSYAAGVYPVTLVVTGPDGVNTNTKPNYITSLTAFQSWQIQYFNSTNSSAAAANADPDGDGQNNMAEFLLGTDPTNSASGFRITSVKKQNADLLITWTAGLGRTNVVQTTTGSPGGSYATNNFGDTSPWIILPAGSGDFTTNYPDPGGATNAPYRYYRIRLQP